MCESAMLERSSTDLFRLPRTLMLLFVAVVFAMGRRRTDYSPENPPPYEIAEATARAKAFLHSGPRQFVPDSDNVAPPPEMVYEASGAVGVDQPSSSDELAAPELFGSVSEVACPDHGAVQSGYPGELHWLYKDIVGK